jgi:hypothetical protein
VRGGGGKGPYELSPSRGWPCLVENNLFSKPREVHSFIFILKDHYIPTLYIISSHPRFALIF